MKTFTFSELYQPISEQLAQQAAAIKLLVCDVDGVFSDGRIYLANSGEELKAFNTKDGFGVKALQKSGVVVAVITGRNSQIVADRMTALGVRYLFQGREDKQHVLNELCEQLSVTKQQVAFIGDDLPDLAAMAGIGLAVSPADGHPLVRYHADYVTQCLGGFGAVRELADLILLSQGQPLVLQGKSE